MAVVTFNCPHCRAEHMTSKLSAASCPPPAFFEGKSLRPFAVGMAICGRCWVPIALRLQHRSVVRPDYSYQIQDKLTALTRAEDDVTVHGFTAVVVRTPPATEDIPEHLPATVAKAFRSAERNFASPDGEDAAAMLYRRAIDIAIREKHPEVKGLLAPRIAKLTEKGLLPPAMKEWADQIRAIGNDGAHEPEGVSKEDLVPLRGFTEAFLRYFLTLPYEVAVRRGEIDDAQ